MTVKRTVYQGLEAARKNGDTIDVNRSESSIAGVTVDVPMQGLGIGQQLAWRKAELQR